MFNLILDLSAFRTVQGIKLQFFPLRLDNYFYKNFEQLAQINLAMHDAEIGEAIQLSRLGLKLQLALANHLAYLMDNAGKDSNNSPRWSKFLPEFFVKSDSVEGEIQKWHTELEAYWHNEMRILEDQQDKKNQVNFRKYLENQRKIKNIK